MVLLVPDRLWLTFNHELSSRNGSWRGVDYLPDLEEERLILQPGDNLGKILLAEIPDRDLANELVNLAGEEVDLRRMQPGQELRLFRNGNSVEEITAEIVKCKLSACFSIQVYKLYLEQILNSLLIYFAVNNP